MRPEEFRKKVLPEGRRLYAFAFRYLNSREDAEDVVQDVMAKLWETRDTLDRYQNIPAWATTVTRNICIDRLRKQKILRFDESESSEVPEVPGTTGSTHDNVRNRGRHRPLLEDLFRKCMSLTRCGHTPRC